MSKRAAIYVRISQDREVETGDGVKRRKGLGVERQRKDCEAKAKSKGWRVVETFTDNDVSATSKKPRPQFQRMLAAIEDGEIDAVVVWDVDRLTRKPRELEDCIDLFDRHKTDLASVGGEIDLATEQGRLMARMKGSVARYEAEQLSRRVRAKAKENATSGLPNGGRRPYGFEKDLVTPRESEAAVLREVARRVLNGQTMRSIAEDLTQRGDLGANGKPWRQQTLKKVLMSSRVAGLRTHNGQTYPAQWPALLDEDLLLALTEAFAPKGPQRRAGAAGRRHHWVGLLRCGKCGHALGMNNVGGRERYTCRPNQPGACAGISVTKAPVDDYLDDLLLKRVERERPGSGEPEDAASGLEDAVEALEKRLEALADDHATGDLDRLAYRAASRKVTERLEQAQEALRVERSRSRKRVTLNPATIRAEWPELPVLEKRALAGAFIERVEVAPASKRGSHVFDPDDRLPADKIVWI
jgi:site-specific DNA recombinase